VFVATLFWKILVVVGGLFHYMILIAVVYQLRRVNWWVIGFAMNIFGRTVWFSVVGKFCCLS